MKLQYGKDVSISQRRWNETNLYTHIYICDHSRSLKEHINICKWEVAEGLLQMWTSCFNIPSTQVYLLLLMLTSFCSFISLNFKQNWVTHARSIIYTSFWFIYTFVLIFRKIKINFIERRRKSDLYTNVVWPKHLVLYLSYVVSYYWLAYFIKFMLRAHLDDCSVYGFCSTNAISRSILRIAINNTNI